jgi:hypothetical protein
MMEKWNRGMLEQEPEKDLMFIKNRPHAVDPIIPVFQHSIIPNVREAN